MSRSLRFPLVVFTAGAAAALFGCVVRPDLTPPAPVNDISIDITGCNTNQIGIIVRPWTAWVARGQPLRWTTPAAVDSVAIQAIDPTRWPFQWGPGQGLREGPGQGQGQLQQAPRQQPPQQRRSARGGQPIQAGTVPADAPIGETYRYRILVYCQGRVLDIDPDLIIRDPY